ncbi:MAG: FHA domain-containing protein [Woeseiaceae bacterium]|nr:FHA domain-containing protein [Woeseiaceae bacterium]
MTNENKKINELVADDDDPTAELEALTVRRDFGAPEPEADANTYDFDEPEDGEGGVAVSELRADLKRRSETIERLQFDVEQLRARWQGLETEIKAREEQTRTLAADLDVAEGALANKNRLIRERDRTIKELKAEIREREQGYQEIAAQSEEYRAAAEELEARNEAGTASRAIEQRDGRIVGLEASLRELEKQNLRTEAYADGLRQQLADLSSDSNSASDERERLAHDLEEAVTRIQSLTNERDSAEAAAESTAKALAEVGEQHEQELRTLRFELDDAQSTLAENESLNEQLASDLIESRGSRDELERTLESSDAEKQSRIDELEKQLRKLEYKVEDYESKLESKSDAINALLGELADRNREIDSIGEMEEVIHDLGERMSEQIDDVREVPEERATSGDRVTRLLIGRIDEQELRFPLFKDRLTIGRTAQNDIQLKAQYISRRHAVVSTEGGATRVIDWGSKNGVYVNSKRITEHFLKSGDIVTIGTAEFRYEERPKHDA